MEIVTRPQPRAEPVRPTEGGSRGHRAGRRPLHPHGRTEQALAEIDGRPLVRIAAEQALASRASPVIVVTGHQREEVERRSPACRSVVHNPDFADGLGPRSRPASPPCRPMRTARSSASATCRRSTRALIDRLIAAFDPERGALVVVPTFEGKRGNPVLWSRRFFPISWRSRATSARAT